jgi:hypothetical protein
MTGLRDMYQGMAVVLAIIVTILLTAPWYVKLLNLWWGYVQWVVK